MGKSSSSSSSSSDSDDSKKKYKKHSKDKKDKKDKKKDKHSSSKTSTSYLPTAGHGGGLGTAIAGAAGEFFGGGNREVTGHPPPYQQQQQQQFPVDNSRGMAPPSFPSVQQHNTNIPPSGFRIALSSSAPFPPQQQSGPPPFYDADGRSPVYVGSALLGNSVHPCKICPTFGTPCRVSYGGGEMEHHGRYDLLPITHDMEWVPTSNGHIPPGRRPVEGGYEEDGAKLYHALGVVNGVQVPGKAGAHLGGASVPFGGGEHGISHEYKILCWR